MVAGAEMVMATVMVMVPPYIAKSNRTANSGKYKGCARVPTSSLGLFGYNNDCIH